MTTANAESGSHATNVTKVALAWLAVGLPLLWGVVETLRKAMALFG
jgi:predicted signal transduction protein with EAL and GGDEF domain